MTSLPNLTSVFNYVYDRENTYEFTYTLLETDNEEGEALIEQTRLMSARNLNKLLKQDLNVFPPLANQVKITLKQKRYGWLKPFVADKDIIIITYKSLQKDVEKKKPKFVLNKEDSRTHETQYVTYNFKIVIMGYKVR